ncbi:PorV/PorQ family protein [bacterium]|nr:PorV/PorQ family protein [bacterium]
MKKILILYFVATMITGVAVQTMAAENNKIAQTGFQFLSVISDARAAAMAGAVNSLEMGSSSLFFNPANMAYMKGHIHMSASDNEWIAGIHHNAYSLALNPAPGKGNTWGVIGVSVQQVDYGDVEWTIVDPRESNKDGYLDLGIIKPSALAVGVGYAKALSTQFSVGGQVRWLKQDMGESYIASPTYIEDGDTLKIKNELTPVSFDFGTLFKTGFKSLVFGMSVKHFSKEISYAEEGFQLPLVFTIGASMDLMDLIQWDAIDQSLLLSVDATHYRSHPEQVILGLDYTLMKLLSVRCGYVSSNDEDGVSFGMGISQFGLQLDYAYTPFGVFDKVQRMTARFSL